jgi:hypothetical protein
LIDAVWYEVPGDARGVFEARGMYGVGITSREYIFVYPGPRIGAPSGRVIDGDSGYAGGMPPLPVTSLRVI